MQDLKHKELAKLDRGLIPDDIWQLQLKEFDQELSDTEEHLKQIKIRAQNLSPNAKLLVIDTGGAELNIADPDPILVQLIKKYQFGSEVASYAQNFIHLMGLAAEDPRLTVWNVAKDPDRTLDLTPIDFIWITGGAAMPSEMQQNSPNTHWLKQAVAGIQKIREYKVPGFATCLGHQLFHAAFGSQVGPVRQQREIGAGLLKAATPEALEQTLLRGVWTKDHQAAIAMTHSESVLTEPHFAGHKLLLTNDYIQNQGCVFPLGDPHDISDPSQVFVTCQSHFEFLMIYLHLLRRKRWHEIKAEGLDPGMLLTNASAGRRLFFNIYDVIERRVRAH